MFAPRLNFKQILNLKSLCWQSESSSYLKGNSVYTLKDNVMPPFCFVTLHLSCSVPQELHECQKCFRCEHPSKLPIVQCLSAHHQCRPRERQTDESHFVNSPWLQHSPCRLLLEDNFSASRCLPAGYASLLRNTSVSHTSCGQVHRSVLSERVNKTARVGWAVANKQNWGQHRFVCSSAGAQTH